MGQGTRFASGQPQPAIWLEQPLACRADPDGDHLVASLAQRVTTWLARVGRTFNRVCGGVFIAIGALLPLRA